MGGLADLQNGTWNVDWSSEASVPAMKPVTFSGTNVYVNGAAEPWGTGLHEDEANENQVYGTRGDDNFVLKLSGNSLRCQLHSVALSDPAIKPWTAQDGADGAPWWKKGRPKRRRHKHAPK